MPKTPETANCFHCGAETELHCSDCAIENELTHKGLPVCATKKCRDIHDEWHSRPASINDLENAIDYGADINILPNGRVIIADGSQQKPLTFRNDLGGEYANV